MKKRALFIDRDGTLIEEPQPSLQVDNLEQLVFLPKVIRNLYFIQEKLDFEFIMVSNQDGLEQLPIRQKILKRCKINYWRSCKTKAFILTPFT